MTPRSSAEIRAPAEVVRIVRRLEEAGFSTWAVGGAVRDTLAGGTPGDWDLATAARPAEVRRLFRRTVPVGIEHGTVGVLGSDGEMYEVTTFRRDVETDGRHARVRFADTLEEDLERRDFTVNAVAWHPLTGEIRDPHAGVADLQGGVLRTVGDPAQRFREDRLRVLRALRFAGRFGLRVEPATWTAAREAADHLAILSAERVRDELRKMLEQVDPPSASLALYAESGVLAALLPELGATAEAGGWPMVLAAVDALPRHRPLLRLAALLHRAGGVREAPRAAAAARELLRRLRSSNVDTDRVVHWVAHLGTLPAPGAGDAALRRWLHRVGAEHAAPLLRLHAALCRATGEPTDVLERVRNVRRVLRARPPLRISDLAIGGAELRALGLAPGPRFGEILAALLEHVLERPSDNRPEILEERVRQAHAREDP